MILFGTPEGLGHGTESKIIIFLAMSCGLVESVPAITHFQSNG
jgi:hypothetical protein